MTTTHPDVKPANSLLDANALGAQLGMSTSSIYRRRSLGLPLPRAIKIGSQVRWTQRSVDEFLAENMEDA